MVSNASPGLGSPPAKFPRNLKSIDPTRLPPLYPGSSDVLRPSSIPSSSDPRAFYLDEQELSRLPPPLVSCSEFVPRQIVELLMRKKKDGAIGVKFIARGGFRTFGKDRLDEITNMEGALHTFVTPVVGRCEMVGDYRFSGHHGVSEFDSVVASTGSNRSGKVMLTRCVVLSASVQGYPSMDFEGQRVMLKVCKLDPEECIGRDLGVDRPWGILTAEEKQDDQKRYNYDAELRKHMVFHLTRRGKLPAGHAAKDVMTYREAVAYLDRVITDEADVEGKLTERYAKLSTENVISLELLFNTAVHQLRNELSALEALCRQGYVYTYDPASIFAREVGPPLLNRLMLAGLRYLSDTVQFQALRIFAFNDFAERDIMGLVAKALSRQPSVQVLRKQDLFQGDDGKYDIKQYPLAKNAMLVIHNNSDGFGQNIETEGDFGSLDGAIGSNSSAAASLERRRSDLLNFVF